MDVKTLFNVKDKVVLVTGGGRGIGLMIATGFVASGAKVYISSRSAEVCAKVASELTAMGPGTCDSIPGDLQKEEDIQSIIQKLSEKEDHLDILVNNSGANWAAPVDKYPSKAFEKVMNLNVNRVFTLTQACLPLLRAKASAEEPSRVINIGSINGLIVPNLETYAYAASKAALHHLTRHLASRLGPDHIVMMAETLRRDGEKIVAGIPVRRIGRPDDIAGACLFLSSRAGSFVNGAVLVLDGGSHISAKM
ncbi:NAD(P)-binding protein [Hesseltinella vesiculosa]|uniref:NAD(P)-binding protein n=1 Tax=Hesseltinella vesiculosa TaxID=101127 RepID=A0A1X2GIT3_9FUNG|nr:NAD(P)-binding protein [Hesseltinella vesiculosa]